jgi:hypothetical protein
LKHCAANRKKLISALPNVGPYIYGVKISGFTRSSIYIGLYDISRLRVNVAEGQPALQEVWSGGWNLCPHSVGVRPWPLLGMLT